MVEQSVARMVVRSVGWSVGRLVHGMVVKLDVWMAASTVDSSVVLMVGVMAGMRVREMAGMKACMWAEK